MNREGFADMAQWYDTCYRNNRHHVCEGATSATHVKSLTKSGAGRKERLNRTEPSDPIGICRYRTASWHRLQDGLLISGYPLEKGV